MVTMLDYIHEEKTALSAILEKNDSSLHVSYQNMQHVLHRQDQLFYLKEVQGRL